MEFWYRQKFNLPPNDPRFLDLTAEEVLTEWYAWFYSANPNSEEAEDEEFDFDAERAKLEDDAE